MRPAVTLETVEGWTMLKSGSGDRYYVRLRVGKSLIYVYFADPLHLPEITRVDASPNEPNPPMWEHE